MNTYLSSLITSTSQFLNVLIFLGNPDETISGRSYRQGQLENHKGWKVSEKIVNVLFFWEKDHCKVSYHRDVQNAKMIVERHNRYN